MTSASPLDRLRALTRPTGEEDLLHVRYPDNPRLRLTPRHGIIAAVVLLVLGAACVLPQLRGAAPPPVESVAVYDDETVADEPEEIVVAVIGHVANPGLQHLPAGARTDDALRHAAPLPEAQLSAINLAQKLSDGQQLYIPGPGETPAPIGAAGGAPADPAAAAGGKVSLNSADNTALEALPGVGEKTAAAIIAHRESAGPFTSIEQLREVKGIGPAKFEALKDAVTL
ncbi:ComE operon protein 1 [Corynebacterium ciconiae DSM 44920]|uniref:helix-hairpin-helix domain-containing protein n=1 Tax=Corynebacterium ciconiae TaxID=227319 RepID=UPI00035FBE11|nr:helix-hairpin-helix domain-containing protein [Corynebacterium ciconiae]WKD60631.1 ComE operon protein 1 [Corynebacterium ciconiae DSM 44920]